jgi:hypothetical protein
MLVGAVEIGSGRQVEAAERGAVDGLRQPERIGGRHQDDLAAHLVLRLERRQFGAQELRHQHARHFVGVQRGLDIHLLAAPGRAEMEAAELMAGAVFRRGDQMSVCLHGTAAK